MTEIVSTEIVLRELLQDAMRSLEEKKVGHAEILKAAAYKPPFKDFLAGKELPPPQVRLIEAAKSAAVEIVEARAVVLVCMERLTAAQTPAVQPPPPPLPSRTVVVDRGDVRGTTRGRLTHTNKASHPLTQVTQGCKSLTRMHCVSRARSKDS